MNTLVVRTRLVAGAWLATCFIQTSVTLAAPPPDAPKLAGTWTLVAADVMHPDGSRASDFGSSPKGLLLIDSQGHYSLQIFSSERPHFSTGDKAKGSDAEYKAAVMGSSTHFGTVSVDSKSGELVFHLEGASYPNWEGQEQRRHYELKDNVLSYRVPPRPNGDVPISVWRRTDSAVASR